MANYFRKYYFEFQDNHVTNPATWRVDIMDSEGSVPTEPFLLTMGNSPLVTERVDSNEDKTTWIIGRQITVTYVFTDEPGVPLPTEFFEANERRFKIEVRKNGMVDGVYFVKPDFCEYPDDFINYEIQIKAIDGLGYSNLPVNLSDENGSFIYDKLSIYEIIVERCLYQIFDNSTDVYLLNSLEPLNMELGQHLLTGCYFHTDIFYDFVKGAVSIKDVLEAFCMSFYARIFSSMGAIWIIRSQDLYNSSFNIEKYEYPSTVTEITNFDLLSTLGPDPSSFDLMPVDNLANNKMLPAIKKSEFEVTYKSINQLKNFDWSVFDGSDFDDWSRFGSPPPTIGRTGSGILEDPYRLYFPYNQVSTGTLHVDQITAMGSINAGDIIEISFKYLFSNVNGFAIRIRVGGTGADYMTLNNSGSWEYTFGVSSGEMPITRSGKKRNGSFTLKSAPIPSSIPTGDFPNPARLDIYIVRPVDPITDDGAMAPAVEIYPIKVGIISLSDAGRHVTAINPANFSQTKDTEDFTFIDTGEDGISNTIFTGNPIVPASSWTVNKAGVEDDDIENHMGKSHIDQYARSLTSWEGSAYSNSLEFYHVIEMIHKPGKRFMQMTDTYDNRTCTHNLLLMEVLSEGVGNAAITQYDIKDQTDE